MGHMGQPDTHTGGFNYLVSSAMICDLGIWNILERRWRCGQGVVAEVRAG